MKGQRPWLRLWPVWAAPCLLLVLNTVWVVGVRGALLGKGPVLAGRVARAADECSKLESQVKALESTRASLNALGSQISDLRDSRLAGMRERLIPFITEVVKLALDAGLRPERVSYTAQRDEKSGLVYFSASYGVDGGYDQIRKLVFLLERSPNFIFLEGLRLQGDEAGASTNIKFGLTVGTYFADIDQPLMKQLGVQEVGAKDAATEQPTQAPTPAAGGADAIQ